MRKLRKKKTRSVEVAWRPLLFFSGCFFWFLKDQSSQKGNRVSRRIDETKKKERRGKRRRRRQKRAKRN